AVVRVMPNTPALIGEGISAMVSSLTATQAQKHLAERPMQAGGKTLWLEDESQMDAWTALAGSGAAYISYLIETMAAAGEAAGLPPHVARQAALQAVKGAALLATASGESPAILRERVTSAGGTTEAALNILM